jgi:lipoprotein-anchoring transpeptidase ErfK/SrfK
MLNKLSRWIVAGAALVMVQPVGAQTPGQAPTANPDLALQVELDRAGFSPGEIDGKRGSNTDKALAAYLEVHKTPPTPTNTLDTYVITEADAAGPFVKVPEDMMEKANLKALGYSSLLEALGERFHCSPALLTQLNPGVKFAAGATITVPGVTPLPVNLADAKAKADVTAKPASPPKADPTAKPGTTAKPDPTAKPGAAKADPAKPGAAKADPAKPQPPAADVKVVVSKSQSNLKVLDASGKIVFYAPVTSGSERDPLPLGEWAVTAVLRNPVFRYNPDLFWDADPAHSKATIPPGPNGPVGLVWIDISKEHYGLHGSPEPGRIAYSQSHGCVRLTNWDAVRLADLVRKGTPVHFVE